MMKKIFVGFGITVALIASVVSYGWLKDSVKPVARSKVSQTTTTPSTTDELLRLVNEERSKSGVASLRIDTLLNQSAQMKADDLVINNYFDHVDATGKHGYSYIDEVGKRCLVKSENIFWAKYDKKQTAVEWWMNSKPHRETMLSADYESIGIGIKDWRVVAHFCDER